MGEIFDLHLSFNDFYGRNQKTTVCFLSIDVFIIYVRKAFFVFHRNLNKNNVQCINPLLLQKDSIKM